MTLIQYIAESTISAEVNEADEVKLMFDTHITCDFDEGMISWRIFCLNKIHQFAINFERNRTE